MSGNVLTGVLECSGACQDPGKIWKGKKMAGRMGNKLRTVLSAWVYKVWSLGLGSVLVASLHVLMPVPLECHVGSSPRSQIHEA